MSFRAWWSWKLMKTIHIFGWGRLRDGGEFESPAVERTQNDVLCGVWPPRTECDFEGTHSKISAMGPDFLATALRAITVSGPSTVYHLVITPRLPFHYCNLTEECYSTWRWKGFIGFLTNNHSSPGHRWCMTSQKTNVRPVFAIPEDL